ncbi:MAG: hypothetical protein A3F43_03815 [Gammaproteobacteria bacterium RIFCSPHIGHO2_12_FULL_42_10]|nr:MAG: hypothetical protein A3F43_03815 [Gammaproteobacteria bacterium RIFCSPHIGHO2_12_FULL_42_10]
MLQAIREHTQGWIAGAITTILILTFALWGIHSYFTGPTDHHNVATVNGINITKDQLNMAYERLRRQAQAQYDIAITNQDAAALKNKALQALIDISVLRYTSIKQGFRIADQQIDFYLESMPEFQVDGQFSVDRFQSVIASTAMSMSDFLELARTSLLIDQPRLGILLTAFSLADETRYTIALVNEERNIDYMVIPFSHFSTQSMMITPDQIKAYYTANQNEFMTPEQVNVEYLLLSVNQLKITFQPTDAMLNTYYNNNINAYTEPAHWKLMTMTVPVAQNTSHEQTDEAQKRAEETVHALKNNLSLTGDFHDLNKGWLTLNQIPTELQQSVASLTTRGQISDPIQTADGFVIIKAIDYVPPKTQTFNAAQDKIKAAYVRQHAEEQFTTMRDQLADLTYEHPDSLESASKTLHLPILASELFTQDKPGKDIAQYKKVREVAFSGDVLSAQNNSDVIQLNPETVIVLRVKSHIPRTLLALKDVTKQIEAKLALNEAEKRIATLTSTLLTELQNGKDPAQIAASNQLTWTHANYMGRYATHVDPAILDTAFRLPNPTTTKQKTVYGNIRLSGGYAIIALNAVKSGIAKDAKQNEIFAEQVEQSEGVLEYELYKQSQISDAKIVTQMSTDS